MTGADILTGGGLGTLLAAAIFAVAQIVKSRSERQVKAGGLFADASAANAVLTSSLKAVQAENNRLQNRVSALEKRTSYLVSQLEQERNEHREELALLRSQLEAVSARLAVAEARHNKDGAL